MKFGKVDNPEAFDLSLPEDHPQTAAVLNKFKSASRKPQLYVGCAKWNKTDLKGFYPKGTKDELEYYSRQFNSIELNATFYRLFDASTYEGWYNKTPDNFKFFPKFYQGITHWKRLQEHKEDLNKYLVDASLLKEKLGMSFIQMHNNFAPKDMDRLEPFFKTLPTDLQFAMEFRHTDWYNDEATANQLYALLEKYNITNVITDTAGRRDLMHMRSTTDSVFIRYTGTNHESDYTRLDDWVDRLEQWVGYGLQNIYFFVHQNVEKASPLLSAYFIEKMNKRLGFDLKVPEMGE